MGRRGPLPEPDNVRALKGLPPRRPPSAQTDRPIPPESLDPLATDYFNDIGALAPHLRLADSFLLAQLADNMSRVDRYRGDPTAPLLKDAHGNDRRNPVAFLLRVRRGPGNQALSGTCPDPFDSPDVMSLHGRPGARFPAAPGRAAQAR